MFGGTQMRSMVQPDQNMMIPELSGIHVHFSFEVSSYSGQTVPKCVLTADFAKAVITKLLIFSIELEFHKNSQHHQVNRLSGHYMKDK